MHGYCMSPSVLILRKRSEQTTNKLFETVNCYTICMLVRGKVYAKGFMHKEKEMGRPNTMKDT